VKILKPPPKFTPISVTCRSCKAELEVESIDEMKRVQGSDQRDGDSWDYLIVVCPCCDTGLQLKTSMVPVHLLSKIKRG
jgi:hypothetical protein